MGRLEEAEKMALAGKAKLSGKNSTAKHATDFGWFFSNLYLQQGKFTEAYRQFQEVDKLFEDSFRRSQYYLQLREKMDFYELKLHTKL